MTRSGERDRISQRQEAEEGADLVSVVLPTFRRSEYLERAIESVFAQSYSRWELLVVDDNSPHDEYRRRTERFMERYRGVAAVRYLKHDANLGGAAARNTGVRNANGELVAFLDDDDVWRPDKLERQVRLMQRSGPQVALVYCAYRKVYLASGKQSIERPSQEKHSFDSLLRENRIGTTSLVLCRRTALLSVGMFDETLPSRQDVDLYIRLARKYDFRFVPETLVTWYRHENAAIGKDRERSVRAHRLFIGKYESDLRQNPGAYSFRRRKLGMLLLNQGELVQARSEFLNAWRLQPLAAGNLCWALVANRVGFRLYRAGLGLKSATRVRSRRLGKAA